MGFEKLLISAQNPYVLAFYRKSLVWSKNWPKLHIFCQFYRKSSVWGKNRSKLHIFLSWRSYCGSVIYNSLVYEFLQVLKNFKFSLKICRCCLQFYRKLPVWSKNWAKLWFLHHDTHIADWLSIMVPHMNFYGFWKFSIFRSKSMVVTKIASLGQNVTETPFFWVVTLILWISYS
jgi:hypothetical protein